MANPLKPTPISSPTDSSPQDIKEAMESKMDKLKRNNENIQSCIAKIGFGEEPKQFHWMMWLKISVIVIGIPLIFSAGYFCRDLDHQSPLPIVHAHIVNAPPKSKIDDTSVIKSAARFVYTAHYIPDMAYSNGKFHAVNVDPKLVETLPFFYTADNGKCVKGIPVPGDPGFAWYEKCLCSDFHMVWSREQQTCVEKTPVLEDDKNDKN